MRLTITILAGVLPPVVRATPTTTSRDLSTDVSVTAGPESHKPTQPLRDHKALPRGGEARLLGEAAGDDSHGGGESRRPGARATGPACRRRPCSLLGATGADRLAGAQTMQIGKVRLVYANFDDGMIAPRQAPWMWRTIRRSVACQGRVRSRLHLPACRLRPHLAGGILWPGPPCHLICIVLFPTRVSRWTPWRLISRSADSSTATAWRAPHLRAGRAEDNRSPSSAMMASWWSAACATRSVQ